MFTRTERYGTLFILLAAAAITLYPIVALVSAALEPISSNVNSINFLHSLSFSSFKYAWDAGGFSRYMVNTAIMTVGVLLISAIVATIAAYAIVHLRPFGSRLLFYVSVIGFMLPVEVLITPWYYELRSMNLLNGYWALILPQAAQSVAFGVFWMRSAFMAVPESLVEAATLDGASRWHMFRFVLIPSVKPALKTMSALVFLWTWNAFLLPLVVESNTSRYVVTIGLSTFQGAHFANYGALGAGAVLAALPVVLVYLISQRSFISGMFAGSTVG
jgi:raffinose/stachyose/melibiose transport system permease protein